MKKTLILFLILTLLMTHFIACKKPDDIDDAPIEDENDENDVSDVEGEDTLTSVDFLNDDLSEYVEISDVYYKNYTVTVDPNRISVLDVENKIIQLLCKNKNKDKIDGDGIISVGDVVNIYYKGYYVEEDGEYCYFNGGSNMNDTSPYALEIGSGGFIPGFEYNLIGKDLDDSPIVVEAFFPEDYHVVELAGVTAYFIVKVDSMEEYDAPELNDTFITETLKLTADALSEFEGDTLVDKFRSCIREELINEKGLDVESLTLTAFWKSVLDGATVKKYPEKQVKEASDSIIYELEYYYNYYYSTHYEFDDFACLYLGLEVESDWKAEVESIAKEQIKQQLIFYQIMNQEGLRPTEEEYEELFDAYLVSALVDKGITPESYDTEEEYLTAKANLRKQLLDSRGEDYFKSLIYYQVTIEAIIGYANIVEITK